MSGVFKFLLRACLLQAPWRLKEKCNVLEVWKQVAKEQKRSVKNFVVVQEESSALIWLLILNRSTRET